MMRCHCEAKYVDRRSKQSLLFKGIASFSAQRIHARNDTGWKNVRNDTRKAPLLILVLMVFVISISGCAPVLIGTAAVGSAIVVTQDHASTSVDTTMRNAWRAAYDATRELGTVEKAFERLGEIKLKVQGASVKVKISKLTEKTVDIKVTARKNLLPDIELAQAVLTNIIKKLK